MYKEIQNLTKVITTEFAGGMKGGKSYHLTPSPSPEIGEGRKITSPHPQPFSLMRRREQSAAFTLAETLITVVILGILAAILVPNLIKNQVENANRTKVKKAMAAYEKAINYMIIENDIKSTEALRELGQDNCQYTREYFKTVQDGTNNCIFKTADRVWWNIADITNPIISLKDEITDANVGTIANNALSLNADTTSFALVGRFDDIGTLRVNDNAYEQGLENNLTNQAYMIKLWHFVNNSDHFSAKEQFAVCKATGANTCTISVNGENIEYELITIANTYTYGNLCTYDREKKDKICNQTSTVNAGDYWVTDKLIVNTDDIKSEEVCASSTYSACSNNGDHYEAAKMKCESQNAHLITIAELYKMRRMEKFTNSHYWVSEEFSSSTAHVIRSNGTLSSASKYYNMPFICVFNE